MRQRQRGGEAEAGARAARAARAAEAGATQKGNPNCKMRGIPAQNWQRHRSRAPKKGDRLRDRWEIIEGA